MSTCLVCRAETKTFLPFGRMPRANGFLAADEFRDEPFFNLRVGACSACRMVQLIEPPERERLFNERYAFFSSTSKRMASHFEDLARFAMNECLPAPDPFVVEIGSNDGILSQHFARAGVRHLGVEPSANVAQAAIARGVNTACRFFDEQMAGDIVAAQGQADVILAANVLCHIPYLNSVAEGIGKLLKPGGILVFEDPYWGDIVGQTAYDQIYDEHAFYFCVASVKHLFERHGLELLDVAHQDVHGGSMRHVLAHNGARKVSDTVRAQLEREEATGLHRPETLAGFRDRVDQSRHELVALLRDLRRRGKRIVGYGATSKSTTVINYCGITTDLIEFISDTTPGKQGKFSPGAHIPVRSHREFEARHPDAALLFAWNHAEEIMAKERNFRSDGGQWIVYVPRVRVLE